MMNAHVCAYVLGVVLQASVNFATFLQYSNFCISLVFFASQWHFINFERKQIQLVTKPFRNPQFVGITEVAQIWCQISR